MKTKILLLFLIIVLIHVKGHTQVELAKGKYQTKQDVSAKIKKFKYIEPGRLENSMEIKVPWNDRNFFDQSLDCYTKADLSNDTIQIVGHMIGELGYGFVLKESK